MSKLIPTPIVDKNGVPSVRYKKSVDSSPNVNLPAPHMKALDADSPQESATAETGTRANSNIITRWQDRRRRRKAIESVMGALYLSRSDVYAGYSPQSLTTALDGLLSTEEIILAAGLAKLVTRNGVPSKAADADRKSIIWSLRKTLDPQRNSIEVRALHAHADWLRDHPGEADKLRKTIENLIELDMVSNGGREGIEPLDEYMASSLRLESDDGSGIFYIWRKDYFNAAARYPGKLDNIIPYIVSQRGFKEDGFDDYMSAAAKHPDQTDRMLDYIEERGTFSEEGFENYINAAAPLAEGAL